MLPPFKRSERPSPVPTPAVQGASPVSVTFTIQLRGLASAVSAVPRLQASLLTVLAAYLSLPTTQLSVATATSTSATTSASASTGPVTAAASSGSASSFVEPGRAFSVTVTGQSYSFEGPAAAAITHLLANRIGGLGADVARQCGCVVSLGTVVLLSVTDNFAPTPAPSAEPFPSSFFRLTPAYQFLLTAAAATTVALALLVLLCRKTADIVCPCIVRRLRGSSALAKVAAASSSVFGRRGGDGGLSEDAVRLLIQEQLRARDIEEVEFESKMEETRFGSKPPPI